MSGHHGANGAKAVRPGRIVILAVGCLLAAGAAGCVAPPVDSERTSVGIFLISEGSFVEEVIGGFKQGFLDELAFDQDDVVWVESNAQGDQALIQSIAREFADSDVDLIAVLGTPAVIAMAEAESTTPIVALAMGDPVGSGVAESLDRPGGNVTGSTDFVEPSLVLAEIMRVEPTPSSLGTIFDPSNQNMQAWIRALQDAVSQRPGLALREVPIRDASEVPAAARALTAEVDVILIGPDAIVGGAALPAVAQAVQADRVPLFLVGGDFTLPGAFASIGPDYPALGRLAGEVAADVHRGRSPAEVPFARPAGVAWAINAETLDQLGLQLPEEILDNAFVAAPSPSGD